MKNSKSYPFTASFIAMAVGILLLCPLRIYQYFKILEPQTGFYSKVDFSVYAMYAIMLFVAIFSVAVAFANKKNLEIRKISLSPVAGGFAFLLAAFGFVTDAVKCFTSFLSLGQDYTYKFDQTKLQYISQQGGLIVLFEGLFALLATIYFVVMAIGYFSKKNVGYKLRTFALALPLWTVARILMKFKTTISFINVSDLFISLFAIGFTMLYLLYFAQTASEVDDGESYFKMFAYGIPAVVFSLACFIPRVVLLVVGRSDLLCTGYGVELCDVLIPVMIIATLVGRSYDRSKENKA